MKKNFTILWSILSIVNTTEVKSYDEGGDTPPSRSQVVTYKSLYGKRTNDELIDIKRRAIKAVPAASHYYFILKDGLTHSDADFKEKTSKLLVETFDDFLKKKPRPTLREVIDLIKPNGSLSPDDLINLKRKALGIFHSIDSYYEILSDEGTYEMTEEFEGLFLKQFQYLLNNKQLILDKAVKLASSNGKFSNDFLIELKKMAINTFPSLEAYERLALSCIDHEDEKFRNQCRELVLSAIDKFLKTSPRPETLWSILKSSKGKLHFPQEVRDHISFLLEKDILERQKIELQQYSLDMRISYQQSKSNEAQDPKKSKKKKSKNAKEVPVCPPILPSLEVLNEESEVLASTGNQIALQSQEKEKNKTKENISCPICIDNYPAEVTYELSCCNQSYCQDCVKTYVQGKVKEKSFPVKCPTHSCKGLMKKSDLKNLKLSASEIFNWEKGHVEYEIGLLPGARFCSSGLCSEAFIPPAIFAPASVEKRPSFFAGHFKKENKNLTYPHKVCPSCKVNQCLKCGNGHPGYSCEEYSKIDGLTTEMLQRKKRKGEYKDCPKCKVTIEKNNGCNHMTCKNCRYEFYWSDLRPFLRR